MKGIIIVPSRLGSTRLANKALADINGKTMIARVLESCLLACNLSGLDLLLATDNDIIAKQAIGLGVNYQMTPSELKTGSDRIFEALKLQNTLSKYDVVINVQGDVPNIEPELIIKTAEVLNLVSKADISTAFYKIDASKAQNPNVVKPVLSFCNELKDVAKALYFTRSLCPHNAPWYYEHIGIYAYRTAALQKFVSLAQTSLEKCESLEQLRAIENSMQIYGHITEHKPISVDTQDDLEHARLFIK
jgi:3-deoxy-manno-octulosonate cytidylyltransferase (CMP-KDO synthetase)